MKVTTVGLDLAKQVFSVHGVDEHGKAVLKKRVSRGKVLELFAQLPPALVGMEACSGAHYWARELERLGHRVGIMAARFVAPYRKSQKNDGNDAEAICEAVSRPSMRFVALKSAEQQALLVLHRVRQGLTAERTAAINQLRGLLAEFGIVLPKGRYQLRGHIGAVLEDAENGIPSLARRAFADLTARIGALDQKIVAYDRELEGLARASDVARRLQQIPGIGPITATALVASVADARAFKNGRQFAAWLGLVPRQYTTGGHVRLGRITKRGDVYLRTLLIHGTRAVLSSTKDKPDRLSRWAEGVRARRGTRKAAVALAAKNARIAWVLLARGGDYQRRLAAG
jgi:transposase